MKPVKLIISGIGPYADKMPEIDFQQFAPNRPVLIAGETGAGKTMIFDAICFALFDTASGSYRAIDNLRSEYAEADTQSFVDFYFTHQGHSYHVYRQPSYMRKSSRSKSGVVQEKEKAVLYQEGREPIEGIKAVNTALGELLHVNEKQFKQLAMIAQGEFWSLLNAKTEERTGILRNIFMTQGYHGLELQLRDRQSRAQKELEVLERSIIQYFQEAEPVQPGERAQELLGIQEGLRASGGLHGIERMLELLAELVAEDAGVIEKLQAEQARIRQEAEQLQKDMALAEDQAARVRRCHELERQLAASVQGLKQAEKQQEECVKQEKLLQERIAGLLQQRSQLSQVQEKLAEASQQHRLVQEEIQRATALNQQLPRYKEARERLAQQQEALVRAQEAHRLAVERANHAEDALACNRAGILARGLVAGAPCPVCGSLEHPAPAVLPQEAVSEEQVKKLRQQEKRANEAKANAAAAAAAAQMDMSNLADVLGERMAECLQGGQGLELVQQIPAYIEAKSTGIVDRDGLLQRWQLVQELSSSLSRLYKQLGEQVQGLEKQRAQQESLEKALEQAQGREASQLAAEGQRLAGLVGSLTASRKAQEEQLAQLRELLGDKAHQAAALEEYRRRLTERLQEAASGLRSIQSALAAAGHRQENNRSRRERIAQRQEALQQARHQQHILSRLYRLVSGQTGNGKLTLEQYVQAAGFDSIIQAANRRLGPMSEGRYVLYRRSGELKNKSHTYLDLEVLDNYTGRRRAVGNLSGGESFKASLALALGLSDMISSRLGGIAMDALFIDEGFGTLDKKSIERALEILLQLSDTEKLVAIISHREELQEAIPQQILVEKGRQGSSIKIEIDN